MHTGMRTLAIDNGTALKYSRIWWTVYIIERGVTCVMGLPMGIADDAISAPLPVYADDNQEGLITEIQVKLYHILAQVLHSTYIELKGSTSHADVWQLSTVLKDD